MRVLESEASRKMTYNIPCRESSNREVEHTPERAGLLSLDSQISKFYRKYGENWKEKYETNKNKH